MILIFKHSLRFTAILFALVLSSNRSSGQITIALQQTLDSIYMVYDSIPYLSFDVKYSYMTDTLYGDFTHDELEGRYTMAGKKAKYSLGGVEFMQNDSVLVTVYNNDQLIVISDAVNSNTGQTLPMRAIMDSMFQVYSQEYTITSGTQNGIGNISFQQIDSTAQFVKFQILYDTENKFLKSITYAFIEPEVNEDSTLNNVQAINRLKTLAINFSNYGFDNTSDHVYEENNYVFFDQGNYKAVDKYKGFRVFNSVTRTQR